MSNLERFAKNNDYTNFEKEYLSTYHGSTATDAAASYQAHKMALNYNSNNSSGIFSSGGGNFLTELTSASVGKTENLTGGLESVLKNIGGLMSNDNGFIGNVVSGLLNMALQGTVGYLDKSTKLIEEINGNLGLSGELSEDFRTNIMKSWPEAERLGVSFEELLGGVSKLVSNSGKFKILDSESMNNMSLASKFISGGIDGFVSMASETEKLSYGVNDTANAIEKMATDSIQLGLNYKKVIDGVNSSLDTMYKYGFKNGIQGLSDMSKKAIEFRMNISDVTQLAEKVFKPEGALETVANLQMIGGAIGDLNDPLKLMYMSTNNIEGLQDSLINATKSLATYNNQLGTFEITGANLRRVRELADATGVSVEQLGKISIATAERTAASTDLMATGIKFIGEEGEKTKEFITNLSRMEGGKMVINIDSPALQKELGVKSQIALDKLTSEQASTLFKYRDELKQMQPIDIAKQQVSILKDVSRNLSFLAAKAQLELGKTESDILKNIGFNPKDIINGVNLTTDKIAAQIPEMGKSVREGVKIFIDGAKSFLNVPEKKIVSSNNEYNNKSNDNNNNNTQTTTKKEYKNSEVKVTVTHGVNSAMLDEWGRSILKSPTSDGGYIYEIIKG